MKQYTDEEIMQFLDYARKCRTLSINTLEDDITKHESWLKYNEQEIEFEYMTEIISADGYWWLLVRCNQLLDLREELNLPRELKFPLHLTIAKIKEERV